MQSHFVCTVHMECCCCFLFDNTVSQYAKQYLKEEEKDGKIDANNGNPNCIYWRVDRKFQNGLLITSRKKKNSNRLASEKLSIEADCLDWRTHNLAYRCSIKPKPITKFTIYDLCIVKLTKSMQWCVLPIALDRPFFSFFHANANEMDRPANMP